MIRPVWQFPSAHQPTEQPGTRGLVAARVQRWKGAETLCEAVRKLDRAATPIDWVGRDTLDGISSGSFSDSLARRYPDVWGSLVVSRGVRSFDGVAEFLCRAAFVVAPSDWDVFNFTVVEAMAAGVPVIASTGAGATELVEDGRNGFTFPSGDAGALAGAIERVAALDLTQRHALGDAARETIRRYLDPSTVVSARLDRYQELAGAGVGGTGPAWLAEVAQPGHALTDPLAFLHHQPLSGLLRHAVGRLPAKIGLM